MTGRPFERPHDAVTTLLVLSARPLDFPESYVVRAQAVYRGELNPRVSPNVMLFKTEAEARRWVDRMYPDFDELGRMDGDEPQIVTVWI